MRHWKDIMQDSKIPVTSLNDASIMALLNSGELEADVFLHRLAKVII